MINALLLAISLGAGPTPLRADTFPHAAHRRVFVTCESCHAGILTGDTAQSRPPASLCANCHDGAEHRRVDWVPAPPRPTNLAFDHVTHFARTRQAGDSVACGTCHGMSATAALMEVVRAVPERCITCHAHRAPTHLAAEANCATCHRSLPGTRLATGDITRFPKPASHDSAWGWNHAGGARSSSQQCAVCHAREYCATCHVNAARVPAILALGSDPRTAVRTTPVVYRAPDTHAQPDWLRGHGIVARREALSCATCHTRESCLVCHGPQARVPVVATLPRREPKGAPGVDLAAMRPPSHLPDFRTNHRSAAAAGDATCNRCHAQTFCATCHDGATRPAFHGRNFVQRHAWPSYNSENECATCHQTQAFCVNCHRQSGLASAQSLPAGRFHTNQPNWTFAHGGAARRSLESCVACHQERFCLQCHSASTGWKVSPHGQGFTGAGNRNSASCRVCHVNGPPTN